MVTLEKLAPIDNIFGKQAVAEHKSDVVRLIKLYERGGIYHDVDVISLRAYPDEWLESEFVMGEQEGRGLCNAVMLSSQKARFAKEWLEQYRNFSDEVWDIFSVILQKELADEHPRRIRVQGPRAFFHPLWYHHEIESVYNTDEWNWEEHPDQYSYHGWESMSYGRFIRNLGVETMFQQDTGFHRMLRPFLIDIKDEAMTKGL